MADTWTAENGKCFFGNHPEEGYARRDDSGEFQPSCFQCAAKSYVVQFVNKKEKHEKTSSGNSSI